MGCAPWGQRCWASCLQDFISLLQAGTSGQVSAEKSLAFQVCPSRAVVSWDRSAPGGGHQSVQLVLRQPWGHCLVLLLCWAWSRNTAEAHMLSPGSKGQGSKLARLPWGSDPCHPSFASCPALGLERTLVTFYPWSVAPARLPAHTRPLWGSPGGRERLHTAPRQCPSCHLSSAWLFPCF